eukprot:TRINITY_DN6161_c0_g3_i9.p1 TRINITY_DN6161_c0_g3~~TRINITY_DN6161_c0_g3_i9.p1  ORF type:complete len:254 (-),score=67.01 TRINITY_DN6161_c0_g3_i9:314-1075(-)
MAPELLRRGSYDAKVDWFSVGVIFYEISHGNFPWDIHRDDYYEKISETQLDTLIRSHPPSFLSSCDTGFQELVSGMLDYNPNSRFSGREVKKLEYMSHVDWTEVNDRTNTPPFVLESGEFYNDREALMMESLGINEDDVLLPLAPEQTQIFEDWNWLNPLADIKPTPQQKDIYFIRNNHNYPMGLRVEYVDNTTSQDSQRVGTKMGKVIFSLEELPVGVSFLTPNGAHLKRVDHMTVLVEDDAVSLKRGFFNF